MSASSTSSPGSYTSGRFNGAESAGGAKKISPLSGVSGVLDHLVEKINELIRFNFFVRRYLKEDLRSFNEEGLTTWLSEPNKKFQHLDPEPQNHFSVPLAVDRLFEELKQEIRGYFPRPLSVLGISLNLPPRQLFRSLEEPSRLEDVVSLMNEKAELIHPGEEDYSWLPCKTPLSEDLKKAIDALLNQEKVQILDSEALQDKMRELFQQIEENGQTEVISAGLQSIFGLSQGQETQSIAYHLERGNPFKRSLVQLLLDNPEDAIGFSLCFFEHDKIKVMKIEEVRSTSLSQRVSRFTIKGGYQEVQVEVESESLKKIVWTTQIEGTLKSFLSRLEQSNSEVCTIGIPNQEISLDWSNWLPVGEYRVELLSGEKEYDTERLIAESSEGNQSGSQQIEDSGYEIEPELVEIPIPNDDVFDSSKPSVSKTLPGGHLVSFVKDGIQGGISGIRGGLKDLVDKIPLPRKKYLKELKFTPINSSDEKISSSISIKLYLDNLSRATYFTISRGDTSKDFSVEFQWFSHCFPVRFKETLDTEIALNEQHKVYLSQTEPFTNEKLAEKLRRRSLAEKAAIDSLKRSDLEKFFFYLISHWSDQDLFKEQGGIFSEVNQILSLWPLKEPIRDLCEIDEIRPGSNEESRLLLGLILRANLEQMAPNLNLSENTDLIKLLGASLERSKDLKEKRGIALLGETGSGKSTTACFLIGARMEGYQNRFGDYCVRIAKDWESRQPVSRLPEVGFALGISKTTFVESFDLISTTESIRMGRAGPSKNEVHFPQNVKSAEFSIIDFPGFFDTRGTNYEVTTSFSLDHGILSLGTLDAIAQVIPYNLLVASRSIYFINALKELSRRFKGCFFNPVLSKKIFFFITKQPHGIGTPQLEERALELIKEEKSSASPDLEKCQVLSFFVSQCRQNRVFPILATTPTQRIDILNQVLQTVEPINQGDDLKGCYELALDGPEMKKKFADVVNDSIGIWMDTIFPNFLQSSKDAIEQIELELGKTRSRQAKYEEEIRLDEQSIERLAENIVRLNRTLAEFPTTAEILPAEWLEELKQNEKIRVEHIEKKIAQIEEKQKALIAEKRELQKDSENKGRKLEELKGAILQLDAEIQKKTTGSYPQVLHDENYSKEKPIPVRSYHEGVDLAAKRRRAIDQATDRVSDHPEEYECKVRSPDETFDLSCITNIDRDYQLLPPGQDQTNAKALNELISGKKTVVLDRGNYTIQIESNKVSFDYIRHHNDGRQICYGYIAKFDGKSSYPCLKITHIIPNAELNHSEVNRCKQEKALLQGRETSYLRATGKLNADIEENKSKLENVEVELSLLQAELENEKKQAHEETVSNIEGRLVQLIHQNEDDQSLIRLKIQKAEREIEESKRTITEWKIQLGNLYFARKRWALFIRTHASHLEQAVKIAQFVVSLKPKKSGIEAIDAKESHIIGGCRSFLKFYEETKAYLEQELNALGLTSREDVQ